MRRLLLAVLAAALLGIAVIVVFFSASRYRVRDQPFFVSLGDFFFLIGFYHTQGFGSEPSPLTDGRYEGLMSHARRTAHLEVRRRVVRGLVRWEDEAVPRLVEEIERWRDPARALVAVEALSERNVTSALPAFTRAMDRTWDDRWAQVQLIERAAGFGPAAAPVLIAALERHRAAGGEIPYNLLDAIGKTGGGVEFLLAELQNAGTVSEVRELLWPLAFTRDERAARALVGFLRHPKHDVRMRARDSMAQSIGPAAIEPALDLLERETDDYVRTGIIERILASREAAGSTRALAVLGRLLDDPVVSDPANYALARIGTAEAIAILRDRTRDRDPVWVIDNLEYSGLTALPFLESFLGSDEARVRRAALWKILELDGPEIVPALERLASDPDSTVREDAARALFRADLWTFEASSRAWLERLSGESLGRVRIPDREGTRNVIAALSFLNWVSLLLSFVIGASMLLGWLRAFDHYRFALTIVFLLVLGILGDYFLAPSEEFYRVATSGRLVLLLGLLFLRDDPLPGETRGRLDRLVVRSLLLLVPLLLAFGAPLLAESLRAALGDFSFSRFVFLLLGAAMVLALEQWVVPFELLPARGRFGRRLAFALSSSVVAIVAVCLARHARESSSADERLLVALFLLALAGALSFHFQKLRLRGRARRRPVSSPPGAIRIDDDGEILSLRLRRKRGFRGLPHFAFGAGFLALTWWLSGRLGVSGGGGPALLFLLIFGMLGTALVSLLVAGLAPSVTLQVSRGAARSAVTFFGGAFGKPAWHRRLRLAPLLARLSVGGEERRYLEELLEGVGG